MLEISVPAQQIVNEDTYEVTSVPAADLKLEHSLISLKRWEEKWHVPFLRKEPKKTPEQLKDYIRCMSINSNVDPIVFEHLPKDIMDRIAEYIEDPMTATWFGSEVSKDKPKNTIGERIITAELLYYWMICLNIPVEFQKWHLNQLITLIRVCQEENESGSKKKRSPSEIARSRKELNEYRKKKLNSRG